MRGELVHTSLPRGLDGGTGFVVAGCTGGMPRTLAASMADLSGLPEAWPGASDWDRTLRATRPIEWRGELAWVASVIRPCGLDHTGRGNRIAHHRLLDASETRTCDPVSMLLDHERWMAAWKGEPRELDAEPVTRSMPGHAGAAETWKRTFGDAGVAAEMLEHAYRSGVGAWIVVPSGTDRLAMLHELAGLLPHENRWKRGWSTRPLRPVAVPAPVIAVVDEREPLVCAAPANAAWILVPRIGQRAAASDALLQRAREGQGPSAAPAGSAPTGSVAWQPPVRLSAPGLEAPDQPERPGRTVQASGSSTPAAVPPIRVELEPAPRSGGRMLAWLAAAAIAAMLILWRVLA